MTSQTRYLSSTVMWDSKEYLGYFNKEKLDEPWKLFWRVKNISVNKGILEISGKREIVSFVFRAPTNSLYEKILEMYTGKYKPLTDEQLFKQYYNL